MPINSTRPPRLIGHAGARSLAPLLAIVLLLAACGGGKGSGGDASAGGAGDDAGDPVRGGSVTYALEAETGDGWCLAEGQLAISGLMVARSIYDTLTTPNAEGEFVPYLAESVEPNDDFTTWTIGIRDGVTFHDGTPLTAEVVKNNLDAYRGQYEGRSPLLALFVMENVDTVEVTGDLEVTVTTKVPWVAFPAFLSYNGRFGIMAQAQLDDTESCDSNLIGTGPFKLQSWEKGRELVAEKNPDYWQVAPDGEPYPYLDEITFEPVVEAEQRVNALESGEADLGHFYFPSNFVTLDALAEDGVVTSYESEDFAEVSFLQLNTSKPPLDDIRIRQAMALAVDAADFNAVIGQDRFTMANGPFAPGSPGYTEDTGFPREQDLDAASALVDEYVAEKGPLPTLTYQTGPSTETQQIGVYMQQTLAEVGIDLSLATVQQDKLISNAISGDYDIQYFRQYPGGDPDTLYVAFRSTSPVNLSRIDDPELDRLFDEGRSETDPATREEIYQDIDRRLADQAWTLWLNWTTWRIASTPDVHGYDVDSQPDLPDGSKPFPGLATGHPTLGMWTTG